MRNGLDTVAVMGGDALDDTWWDVTDVARYLDISPKTVRSYLAAGRIPAPDRQFGRSNVWRSSVIRAWHAGRPGQGARTDLRPSDGGDQ